MREYLHKFAYHYDKKNDKSFLNVLYKVKKNRNNEIYKCPFYNVILNTNYKIQGWKIHISPFLDDYEKVLEIVIKKLVEEKVTFKFVPYLSDYLSLSDKNTSPSQFGKYITIYPHNVQQFKKLNSYFASVLLKFDGVRVPSDLNYKNSTIISYRYGGFFPNVYMNNEADLDYKIMDGKGHLVEDNRKTFYKLLDNISPVYPVKENNLPQSVVIQGEIKKKKYKITNIIRRLGTGNIYLGMNLYSGEQVIIKEARLGSTPTTTNCRYRLWDLKKNEFNLLNNRYFQKNINLPKPEDIFHYKDSFFIIEKKINGITLRKFISQNPLLVTKKYKGNFSNYNRHLKNIIENILLLIFSIHQAGYIMNDISDDNFLIDLTTDKVSVIDIESISKMEENKYRDVETARYILRKPENLTDINADYYKLSLLFLYLIFGKINEFLVDEHFFEKRFQLLKDKMSTIQKDVVNFSLWLYKKSKNNFVDLNTEKIIINKFKFRKFDEEALDNRNLSTSEILTQIKKYYIHKFNLKFDDKFKGTNYLGDLTKYTLTYGILGSMILGKKLAWISEVNLKELIQKVHIEINKNVEKNQLNNGLFFGLAGAALFDYYMDIPFEDNVYLFKLINRINSETNTSFANGLAGIIYALQEMSKNKGYPDFKEIIDSISLSHKEPNNNDEGFEYGDIGWAYILLREYKVSSKTFYLNVASKILKRSTSKYLNEKPFMGISYNSKLWPNIRCPYFMYGSAGLIYVLSLFYNMTGQFNWKIMEKYLTSLNQPYAYNYGFNNGAAGILYVLIKIKEQRDIPGNISQKINSMILNYKRMLLFHYQNKNEVLGWPTDGQIDFADDIGSGTLGIYLVLRKLI